MIIEVLLLLEKLLQVLTFKILLLLEKILRVFIFEILLLLDKLKKPNMFTLASNGLLLYPTRVCHVRKH